MRFWLSILASFVVLSAAKAQIPPSGDLTIPINQAFQVDYAQFVLNGTTNPIFTNQVVDNLYHTIQFANTGTNTFQYVVDVSVAGTNWFIGATNSVIGTNVAEATLTKKETYMRIRIFGTNMSGNVDYVGGR